MMRGGDLRPNGTYPVEVKTLNGGFCFDLARFKTPHGSTNYFREASVFGLSDRYESQGLVDFVCRYATQMSYTRVSELAHERCSGVNMSDQHIQHLVLETSEQIGQEQQVFIDQHLTTPLPNLCIADIYSIDDEELVWFEDGVCVSEQKPCRDKVGKLSKQRTTIDSLLVATPQGGFAQVVAATGVELSALAQTCLKGYYTGKSVAVVVLSDGSRTIKNRCVNLFGSQYVHILDWYHLQRKVKDLMTMIAPDKELKVAYCQELVGLLWGGDGATALIKLRGYRHRNAAKWEELINYLVKNESHLIDYARRQGVGKPIGSGRMEKAGDLLVARRQKEKGMSWSAKGSRALAVLTAHYNGGATDYLQ
jgi:hypothetical protein